MRSAVLGLVLLLSACESLTSSDYEPPSPDPSRDPAALREGSVLFACGGWRGPTSPADSMLLVDAVFARTTLDGPFNSPTWSERILAARYGAKVVHTFNTNAARVRVAIKDVPRLRTLAFIILSVPDPRRYDWPVTVGFKRDHQFTPNDVAQFVRLGGRVTHQFERINAFAGVLPDASIAVLRTNPRVRYVEGSPPGAFCLD